MAELQVLGNSIGTVLPVRVPDLSDDADIVEALQLFYYGNNISGPTTADVDEIPATSIAGRLRDLTNTKLNIASPTTTGKLTTAASASGSAGFNIPQGSAPSSPVNGDIWTTSSGLFARIGGGTKTYVDSGAVSLLSLQDIDNLTNAHTLQIGYGANTTGLKTINIGTGSSGSGTTSITLGSTTGTTITLRGTTQVSTLYASGNMESSGTGSRYVAVQSDDNQGNVYVSGYNGYAAQIELRTSGSARWIIRKDAVSESGSDVGSDLSIVSRSDSLVSNTRLTISRASGRLTIGSVGSTGGLELGSSGPRIMAGSGAPNMSAPVGSTWKETSTGAVYQKYQGTDGAGWGVQGAVAVDNYQTGPAYTLLSSDIGKMVRMANTSTVYLPATNLVAGGMITVVQLGGQVTFADNGNSVLATPGKKLRTAGSSATLWTNGSGWWVIMGDLVA
jgi:hypothetical protein